jgi:hypothetical protein
MKKIIEFKRNNRLIATGLPPKFLRAYTQGSCPICMATKRRRKALPLPLPAPSAQTLLPWEMCHVDSSGKFRVAMTTPSRDDPSKTIFESAYGAIPNLC